MAEEHSRISLEPTRQSASFRNSNPDIFSDDFALEPLELTNTDRPVSPNQEGGHDATLDTLRQSFSTERTIQSPSGSLRQSRGSQRSQGNISISSQSDNRTSQFSSHPRSMTSISDSGNTTSTQHRSVRTISTFGFPRAQSPYQGATGPSQPYGMYSQNTGLARNPSIATTSTIRRPERTYSGPTGPTQPYGMYAQNTVPEDDADLVAGLNPSLAAGLPATHQGYQRRLGPDGEDADDLIGPDGYTEQLPPYSRYANGVPPKYTSGFDSVSHNDTAAVPLDNSQETLRSPQSADAGLVNPFADSSTQVSTNLNVVPPKDEGGNFKERVRRRGKKKVCCGISCWLCMGITAIVFLAVLLGGVIGGIVAHKRGEQKGMNEALSSQAPTPFPAAPTATVTMTPPPDAISLTSTPSNLPPLPTGTFAITLNQVTVASNSCLTDINQSCAWDCATGAQLNMEVQMTGPQQPMVSLSYIAPPNPTIQPPQPIIRYGAQPPQLGGQASLFLMRDKDQSSKGPAYLFTQAYNKTVIVHNADLNGGTSGVPGSKRSLIKRWLFNEIERSGELYERGDYADSQYSSDTVAQVGDKPWYCYWPGTILEGFIYVTQNADGTTSGSAAMSGAALTTSAPSAPSQGSQKRQAPASVSPYPKLVKIEERRSSWNPVKPYCQQMQILNTYEPGPVTDQNTGQLVQIQLDETEPSMIQHQFNPQGNFGPAAATSFPSSPSMPTGLPGRRRTIEKRDVPGAGSLCQCEWESG